VPIWGAKWINRPISYQIQSPYKVLSADGKVAELIDAHTGGWDRELICRIVDEEEMDLICNIPISRYGKPGRLIWCGTNSGIFTV
jgi:hypothetical protein